VLETQVREHRRLIYVHRDLFDPTPRRDVLSAGERGAPRGLRKADQVFRYQWHGTSRTLLPRSIGSRIDDDLTEHSPTRMVRVAARDEEPAERLGDPLCIRLRSVTIKVPERRPDPAAVVNRACQLAGSLARLVYRVIDAAPYCRGTAAPRLEAECELRILGHLLDGPGRLEGDR
jgi:hypothetical protein